MVGGAADLAHRAPRLRGLEPVREGDGLAAAADCDDANPAIGGEEAPYDGVDNDCDERTPDDDLDGDGLAAADDCDEANPLGWLAPDTLAGERSGKFTTFCAGYGERRIGGDLDLSGAKTTDVAAFACLTAIDGDLITYDNRTMTTLSGLENLSSVGYPLITSSVPDHLAVCGG